MLLSLHFHGGTEETMKNLSQDNWSPGQDINLGPPKYEPEVLTI
jgi:hypothetical protein